MIALDNIDTTNGNGSNLSFRGTTTGTGATTLREFAAIQSVYSEHDHATASASLRFWTRSNGPLAERMRIDTTGNVGIGTTTPDSILDISGALTIRGLAAPSLSPAGQGRMYFDSTSNKYRVSQNGGAYVDLIPSGGAIGGSGTTNALPRFSAASTLADSAIVDNGTTIVASRSIATTTNPVATGATLNLGTSNTHTLTSVGGSVITISNQSNGGVYNIAVEDTTSRTYTFSGCTNTYYKPANAPTQVGTRTVYGLMTIQKGANWDCYVTWSSGFQ